MKEIIKLHDLLGSEVRSRSNAEILREKIAEHSGSIIDLSDVSFISRSFADELCILVEKHIIQFDKNVFLGISIENKSKR